MYVYNLIILNPFICVIFQYIAFKLPIYPLYLYFHIPVKFYQNQTKILCNRNDLIIKICLNKADRVYKLRHDKVNLFFLFLFLVFFFLRQDYRYISLLYTYVCGISTGVCVASTDTYV